MNFEHLICGRESIEVDRFINTKILPIFKEIKHLTFPKETFDDIYTNYIKQIDARYAKLITRRFFLRCLMLGMPMMFILNANQVFRGQMENLV